MPTLNKQRSFNDFDSMNGRLFGNNTDKPRFAHFLPPKTTSVYIAVCFRMAMTRPNGVELSGGSDYSNASSLPAPETRTHTSRAAAMAA
jgi:hypothetical protein